jgi:hypothetical protein
LLGVDMARSDDGDTLEEGASETADVLAAARRRAWRA